MTIIAITHVVVFRWANCVVTRHSQNKNFRALFLFSFFPMGEPRRDSQSCQEIDVEKAIKTYQSAEQKPTAASS